MIKRHEFNPNAYATARASMSRHSLLVLIFCELFGWYVICVEVCVGI